MAATALLAAAAIVLTLWFERSGSAERPILALKVLLLHAIGVWSACRAYYFAFYVIEKYIDAGFRFAGVGSAIVWIVRSRAAARSVAAPDSAAGLAGADDRLDQAVRDRTGQ